MARTIVGLEITEESVRAVEVTAGRSPVLVAAGEVPLPAGAAHDSEVLDPDAVAVAIRQLWSRAGIGGKRVVLGIGSRRVLVREYSTQAMKPELLRQSLPFQVQDLLPVPVSQAVLDFYPFSEEDGQVHGLLVAAVAETIETLIATLAKAKLVVDVVDLVPFGLARVARRLGRPGEATAMVHIGDHTSYVVVSVDGVPRFVRIIPIDVPTSAARARAHSAPIPIVREPELALAGGAAPSGGATGAVDRPRSVLRAEAESAPAVSDLADRVRSTLAFYRNRPGATRISTVCVSGAGMAAEGMRGELARVLEVPPQTVTAHAIVSMTGAKDPSTDLDLNLVSTIGLTLGGDGPMKRTTPALATAGIPRVNLMPRAETERRERDALARRWGVGLLAALLVVVLGVAGTFWLRWTAQQRLAADQVRTNELLVELASLSEVSQALALRTELQGFRADAMVSDLSWSGLFADLATALPAGVSVTGFDLTVGAAPAADDPEAELSLTGTLELRSATPVDMAPAVRALRQVPGVAQVDPAEITSEMEGDQRTYVYRLPASFDQTLYTGEYAGEGAR